MDFSELVEDDAVADEPPSKRVRIDESVNQQLEFNLQGDNELKTDYHIGTTPSEQPGVVSSCGLQHIAGVQELHGREDVNNSVKQENIEFNEPQNVHGTCSGPTSSVEVVPTDLKITPGAYTQREEFLIKQEQEGEISFCYVENDGTPQNMIFLTGLKNIFSKQLPNMPKEYICRLVFDRRHRSTALVKRNGQVIGGITYRAFHQQGFGEIAFCAVTSSEQVKGFGTRLMNHAKEFARTRDCLTHFLTYADNNAVGYFAKQGFTKEVTLERERWHGFIKDYDGGTLMECVMNPKICFTKFPDMIRAQRTALDLKIRSISNAHVVRKGLTYFKEATAPSGCSSRPPLAIETIPGVKEACWTPEQAATGSRTLLVFKDGTVDANPESLQQFMVMALKHLQQNEDAWPFLEPVSKEDVPDYHAVIKDPVDLSLMEQRLKRQNYYLTLDIFVADFKRMMNNCRVYNNSETIYYKLANKLEATFNNFLAAHVINEQPIAASTPSQQAAL